MARSKIVRSATDKVIDASDRILASLLNRLGDNVDTIFERIDWGIRRVERRIVIRIVGWMVLVIGLILIGMSIITYIANALGFGVGAALLVSGIVLVVIGIMLKSLKLKGGVF